MPPSAVGDANNLDAMGLLASNKGRPMQAIVEQARDGSTLRVYLLPEFQFVQVFVAGIQVKYPNLICFPLKMVNKLSYLYSSCSLLVLVVASFFIILI